MNSTSPLAVVIAVPPPENAARAVSYPEYIHEILGHAGVCYETVAPADLPDRLGDFRLLLTIGDAAFPAGLLAALRAWLENGGAWVAVGGLCGAGDLFGVEPEPPAFSSWGGGISSLGEGYLEDGGRRTEDGGTERESASDRQTERESASDRQTERESVSDRAGLEGGRRNDESNPPEHSHPFPHRGGAGGEVRAEGGRRNDESKVSERRPPFPSRGGAGGELLHFFNGAAVRVTTGEARAMVRDAHGRPTSRPAMVEQPVGRGRCLFIAPDITGTIVRIQQGIAVTRDGVSAPDGTAPLADAVLKSGDGGTLDWIFDRQPVEGAPGLSAFLEPIADGWRDLLLRSLFTLAIEQNAPLPLLWLYPRDLRGLGHLSHDTDGSDPVLGRKLLETLHEAGVKSTWCVILPGYPPELIDEIREAGHELAMHFDAMTPGCPWNEEALDRQWRRLCALLGEAPVSNKNHYLRWEGDTEYFDWLAKRGVKLDQSKGASKTGEAGFNFGTCHPYFSAAPDGRIIDVLELATPTQDLEIFAPRALLDPLLESVVRCHGILHLLFHPAHIAKPGVAEAIKSAVDAAHARGMEWWTAREINDWERARRDVRWIDWKQDDEILSVTLEANEALAAGGPSILLLDTGGESKTALVNGAARPCQRVERWGFAFWSISLNPADAPDGRFKLQWKAGS